MAMGDHRTKNFTIEDYMTKNFTMLKEPTTTEEYPQHQLVLVLVTHPGHGIQAKVFLMPSISDKRSSNSSELRTKRLILILAIEFRYKKQRACCVFPPNKTSLNLFNVQFRKCIHGLVDQMVEEYWSITLIHSGNKGFGAVGSHDS